MAKSGAIRAGKAYVEIFADDSKLIRGLKGAETRLKAFGAAVSSIGKRFMMLGGAITAPFVAAAKSFEAVGSALNDMSGRTGMTVENLSLLGFAAEMTGANLETVEGAARRMQKTIAAAAGGNKAAAEALADLGLSAAQLAKLSPDEQFERIGKAIAGIPDDTRRAAAAMTIFGRQGTALLPMLADLDNLRRQGAHAGAVVSAADAKAADDFGDKITILTHAVKAGFRQIGAAVIPILTEFAERVINAAAYVREFVAKNKDLIVEAFKIGVALTAAGTALLIMGKTFGVIAAGIGMVSAVLSGIGAAFSFAQAACMATVSAIALLATPIGLAVAALATLTAAVIYFSGVGGAVVRFLGQGFTTLAQDAAAAFTSIGDALAAGDIALAGKILWLTLKMEWLKGCYALTEIWTAFTFAIQSRITAAWYKVLDITSQIATQIRRVWVDATASMSSAWAKFAWGAAAVWGAAQNAIAEGVLQVMGLMDPSMDLAAAQANLRQQARADEVARNSATNRDLDKIEKQRRKDQTQIGKDRADEFAGIGMEKRAAIDKLAKDRDAKLGGAAAARDQAVKDWQAARLEALKKSRASGTLDLKDPQFAPFAFDAAAMAPERKFSVAGTFNAAAVRGMGGNNAADRTARATERSADRLDRIERNTRDMLEAELEFA